MATIILNGPSHSDYRNTCAAGAAARQYSQHSARRRILLFGRASVGPRTALVSEKVPQPILKANSCDAGRRSRSFAARSSRPARFKIHPQSDGLPLARGRRSLPLARKNPAGTLGTGRSATHGLAATGGHDRAGTDLVVRRPYYGRALSFGRFVLPRSAAAHSTRAGPARLARRWESGRNRTAGTR